MGRSLSSEIREVLARGFTPPPKQDKLPNMVNAVLLAIREHILASPHVRQYVEALPKGPNTFCPNSPDDEIIAYMAHQRGEIDKKNPALNLEFHREIMMPVFAFERDVMLAALEQCPDAFPHHRAMVVTCAKLARLLDELWAKWFAGVAVQWQSLSEEEQGRLKNALEGQLPKFDYTVFRIVDDSIVDRKPWAVAFPDEIHEIYNVLRELVFMDDEFTAYWVALQRAYACSDIDKLEELWRDVDIAFVQLPIDARFIPMHGIESGYEHPICVSPEFRLGVRTDIQADLIAQYRAATVDRAVTKKEPDELVETLRKKLQHTDVAAFIDILRSGVGLNFKYSGQSTPNRQDVQAEHGARIFLDPTQTELMAGRYRALVEKHCAPETATLLVPLVTAEDSWRMVTGHEFSHPYGRSPEIDAAIGTAQELLEEAKASAGAYLIGNFLNDTPENRRAMVANIVARIIRFMTNAMYENPTAKNYVRENLVMANILADSGILGLTENGIVVDLDAAENPFWIEETSDFFDDVVNAYWSQNVNMLTEGIDLYCDESDGTFLQKLHAWVNR